MLRSRLPRRKLSVVARAALAALAFAAFGVLQAGAYAQTPARPRRAQQSPPSPAPSPDSPDSTNTSTQTSDAAGDNADLSITARVTARELRFEKVPNPTVEFTGRPRRDTVWEAERENLPAQVRPGETYRDIGITLRITSVFADIERIVAEALGEVPVSEDAPTTTPQTTTPQTTTPTTTTPAMTPTITPTTTTPPRPLSPAQPPATSSTTQPRRVQPRGGRNR